jgi:hypothetical protein
MDPKSIPEELSLVIQSPLAIGSQKKISLRVLCASAVNLVLRGTNDNPKPQWNQPSPLGIPLNLDSNVLLLQIDLHSFIPEIFFDFPDP